MATAAACSHPVKSMFRCRRCRQCLLFDDVADVRSGCALCSDDAESQSQVWYLQEEAVPLWIQSHIEEANWTRGKLLCPKCRGRLGSFDFTMQPKCRQGHHLLPSVHLVKSRVDRSLVSPPVARVKPFHLEEGLWSNSVSETECTQNSPSAVKPTDCSSDAILSGSNPRLNSNFSPVPKDNAMPGEHIPPHCQCSRPDAACASGPSHSHTCCLVSGYCVQPPLDTDRNVFGSYPCSSRGMCSNDRAISRGMMHCCHHACLPESSPHSTQLTKLQLDSSRQTSPRESDVGVLTSLGTSQSVGGVVQCSGNFAHKERGVISDEQSHPVVHRNTDSSVSSRPTNIVRPEMAPCLQVENVGEGEGDAAIDQEEGEDDSFLEWDFLEELEEINSSILSLTVRAEARRERNRRKRVRRKLRRRGNTHRLFLEGDLKSLPPSKFEELTGLHLGDRSVQEYTICVVCLDLFVNPRACSPCGHLFCEQCLRQLTRFNPTSAPCPLCRTVIEVTIPHEELSNALQKLFPYQTKQKLDAYRRIKQRYPLPRAQNLPAVWLPLFGQRILSGRNRRRMFWSLQPNSSLDYHDFGRLWVQTLRWRFTVAGYGILALLLVCACSVLVINFV